MLDDTARNRLLELLVGRVEIERVANPDEGYSAHLRNALDYRRWHTFDLHILRRDASGEKRERYGKRVGLSGGEKRIIGYLALWAALASIYDTLQAANPECARLVLLDDAFVQIDEATHPRLFGLLAALDLDFLVTSERLWGTVEELRALSIYQLLRNESEWGVAAVQFRWDGRQLQPVS